MTPLRVIEIRYARLDGGLWLIARRDEQGNMVFTIDERLDASVKTAAAKLARRMARKCGWAPGLLPVGLLPAARLAGRPLHLVAAGMTTAGIAGVITLAPAVMHTATPAGPSRHARRQDRTAVLSLTPPAGRHRKAAAAQSAPGAVSAAQPPSAGAPPSAAVSVQAQVKLGKHALPVNLGVQVPPLPPLPVQLPPVSVCASPRLLGLHACVQAAP